MDDYQSLNHLEATTMVLGHAMSSLVGSVEAMTGDDKKKRRR